MEKGDDKIFYIKASFGSIFFLSGIGIWVYQIYYWLKYAEWNNFSLLWPLSYSSKFEDWVYFPYEWVGIHKILDFIPLSIVLVIIGFLVFAYED